MGKGLAALTFDDEYQRKRRQSLNKKPKTFQEGMAQSSKGLVMVKEQQQKFLIPRFYFFIFVLQTTL